MNPKFDVRSLERTLKRLQADLSELQRKLPAESAEAVDVFFLYPTIYQQAASSDPMVCAVDNAQMRVRFFRGGGSSEQGADEGECQHGGRHEDDGKA